MKFAYVLLLPFNNHPDLRLLRSALIFSWVLKYMSVSDTLKVCVAIRKKFSGKVFQSRKLFHQENIKTQSLKRKLNRETLQQTQKFLF